MNDLQIALIAVGSIMVALVWAYNRWQERKHLKTAAAILKGDQRDALLPDSEPVAKGDFPSARREPLVPQADQPSAVPRAATQVSPSIDLPAIEPKPSIEQGATIVPEHESTQVNDPGPELPTAELAGPSPAIVAPGAIGPRIVRKGMPTVLPPLPPQWADSIADCILRFSTSEPIEAEPVWQSQRLWASDLSKPLHWLVFDPLAAYGGSWRCLSEHDRGAYNDWAISLQLVDRRGPVSDTELAHFLSGAQKYIRQMGGESLVLPERGETLAYATKLDRFCADIDIQFSVHIVEPTGGSFAGSKLRSVVEAAGMVLDQDGAFRARDADGIELYSLSNTGEEKFSAESIRTLYLKDLTLTLDVPRVADAPLAFDKLLATARQLSKALGGVLVDAQRSPLEPPMIGGIRAKAAELQKRMRDGGISPGSVRAFRLFS